MRFTKKTGKSFDGHLIYSPYERSFDFSYDKINSSISDGVTASLVIAKTLQIEFLIENGQLLYVWGYCPHESWVESSKGSLPIGVESGAIFVDLGEHAEGGFAYGSSLEKENIYYNKSENIAWVGEMRDATPIEIAKGIIIGLREDDLSYVMLSFSKEDSE